MASLKIASLIVFLLTFTLTLCEAASRPMMLGMQKLAANAEKSAQAHSPILPANLTTRVDDISSSQASQTTTTLQPELAGDCHTSDIIIEQDEVSGVGLPTFQVQITNSCTNPRCSISFIIVQCGLFHSGEALVNPKVFRRLDPVRGTCIVNDGQPIRNADTIIFRYNEIWKQPIRFLSARIFCHA